NAFSHLQYYSRNPLPKLRFVVFLSLLILPWCAYLFVANYVFFNLIGILSLLTMLKSFVFSTRTNPFCFCGSCENFISLSFLTNFESERKVSFENLILLVSIFVWLSNPSLVIATPKVPIPSSLI